MCALKSHQRQVAGHQYSKQRRKLVLFISHTDFCQTTEIKIVMVARNRRVLETIQAHLAGVVMRATAVSRK